MGSGLKNMLYIAICENKELDRENNCKTIKRILDIYRLNYKIEVFEDIKQLLLSAKHFDLIFLDTKIKELNKEEEIHQLEKKRTESLIILLTSSKNYIYHAFDSQVFQYLLKPLKEDELEVVLIRSLNRLRFLELEAEDYIIITKNKKLQKVYLKEILYFEVFDRIIYLHKVNSHVIDFYSRINCLEEKLKERDFFRSHKSYLVNLRYVVAFDNTNIILNNKEKIPLSKRRYSEFIKTVTYYMENGNICYP